MSTRVYSTRFGAGEMGGGSVDVYTVPEGYTAVVHCVTFNSNSGGGQAVLALGTLGLVECPELGAAGQGSYTWTGRLVFNAGEVMAVYNSVGDLTYSISGYLLID